MKQTLTLLSFLFISFCCAAQGWEWAREATCSAASSGSFGLTVKTDAFKNVYVLMDNSNDSLCLNNNKFLKAGINEHHQLILAKYDSSGNLIWARSSQKGSCASNQGDIAIDVAGNVYLYSAFDSDSIRFGNHVLTRNHNGIGYACHFIVKYNANGDIIWAIQNHENIVAARATVTDLASNVYIIGEFNDSTLHIGPHTLINAGHWDGWQDIFLAKYDSSGHLLWAKSYGGTREDRGLKIDFDEEKNKLYLAGGFSSPTIAFDAVTLTYTGQMTKEGEVWLAQMDTSGHTIWAHNSSRPAILRALTIDYTHNIYIGGSVEDTIVGFGNFILHEPNMLSQGYVAKYDDSGNVLWAKAMPTTANQGFPRNIVYGLSADACNNIWCAGSLNKKGIKLDSNTILDQLPPTNNYQTFFTQYTPGGILQDHFALSSGQAPYLSANNSGLYMTATNAKDPLILGNDSLHLYNGQVFNFFLAKYNPQLNCDLQAPSLEKFQQDITLFPNPATNTITIQYNNNSQPNINASLYDITGRLMSAHPLTGNTTTISVQNLSPGIYQCRIMLDGHTVVTKKMVVMK